MMRVVTMVLLLSACGEKREPEPTTETAPETPAMNETAEIEANETAETGTAEPAEDPSEPTGEPIELLHAVPVAVSASSAYRDDVGQIARLFDGDLESTWNGATGDLDDAFIEILLPDEAQVTEIEMTVGYTKVNDGRDLFTGNHRVSRVRVLRGGTEVASRALAIDNRELQPLGVTGPGGLYRIALDEFVAGDRPNWREPCVSEIRVLGHAPGASAGTRAPDTQIGPIQVGSGEVAEGEGEGEGEGDGEGEGEGEGEDYNEVAAGEDASGPLYLAEREGLHLSALVLATGVESRQPVDPRTTFSKASDERVFCYLRIENPERETTTVTMTWERAEGPGANDQSREMDVYPNPTHVTFAFTGTQRRAGRYACVIRDANAEVLGRAEFELTD